MPGLVFTKSIKSSQTLAVLIALLNWITKVESTCGMQSSTGVHFFFFQKIFCMKNIIQIFPKKWLVCIIFFQKSDNFFYFIWQFIFGHGLHIPICHKFLKYTSLWRWFPVVLAFCPLTCVYLPCCRCLFTKLCGHRCKESRRTRWKVSDKYLDPWIPQNVCSSVEVAHP